MACNARPGRASLVKQGVDITEAARLGIYPMLEAKDTRHEDGAVRHHARGQVEADAALVVLYT